MVTIYLIPKEKLTEKFTFTIESCGRSINPMPAIYNYLAFSATFSLINATMRAISKGAFKSFTSSNKSFSAGNANLV